MIIALSRSRLSGGSSLKVMVMHQEQIRGDTGLNSSGRGFLDYHQCTGWILGHFRPEHPTFHFTYPSAYPEDMDM